MPATTLAELIADLQAAIQQGGGNLDLNAQLAQEIPAVATLLDFLELTDLLVTGAHLTQTIQNVTVTGTAPVFAQVSYNVVLEGTVVAGTSRLKLSATPAQSASWTFASNFAALPNYKADQNGQLVSLPSFFDSIALTNPAFAVASFTDPVEDAVEGLTFLSTFDTTQPPFDTLGPYLPLTASMPLAGGITMRAGLYPLIDLRTQLPSVSYQVGLLTFGDVYLRLRTEGGDGQNRTIARLGGSLFLDGSPSSAVFFEATLLEGLSVWAFQSTFDTPEPLPGGKEELSGYLGGNPMLLPLQLLTYTVFDLESLSFGIVPQDSPTPQLSFLSATVGTQPWDTPIPKIAVDNVAVDFYFYLYPNSPPINATTVRGTLRFGEMSPVHIDVRAIVPEFDIEAELRDGDQFVVSDLIEWFTGKSGLLGNLSVTSLNLWAYPARQEFSLFTEVTGIWPYPVAGVTFDFVNLYVYYTPNSLEAVVSAQVTFSGRKFSVRAATPTQNKGWIFSGGLMPSQRFSLQDFLAPWFPSLPASVAAIALTKLGFRFETKVGDWLIDVGVGWQYEIVDYAFDIAAEVFLQAIHSNGNANYSGFVKGDFKVNSLAVTAIYAFQPNSTTITFRIAYKRLKLQGSLIIVTKGQVVTKKLVISFPDLSLGDVLAYLVGLATGNSDYSLSSPWDSLNQITFKNVSLEVDLNTNDVALNYEIKVDLVFIQIDDIRLSYSSGSGNGSVKIGLSGKFLNKTYGKGNRLEWDVLNDSAPEVPASGSQLLDLRYLGFGHHVSFSGRERIASVAEAIAAMKQAMQPVDDGDENPLASGNGSQMRFDRASGLLIGADFTILGTFTLSLIFNDPYLYGMAIGLDGARAGALAGLRFELLYQRITNDIGVFRVVLRVPDRFRQLDFGEVSITLPVIKVDVYTNGNFRIDLGFPAKGDFTDSFCIQVFPFIGYGGFYFALLTGATSNRVPAITNGSFDPVIEFGIGLRVGLGKEFSHGPLSGGLSVTFQAILEGVVAWFTPTDRAITDAKYYWVQGVAGIVGKLYGSVDFVVIKASVCVEARAIATLVIESYEPIIVRLSLQVEASASITILFVTVDFSFSLEIDEEFVIGHKSTPPWILAAPKPPTNSAQIARSLEYGLQPRLRMQRGHYRRKRERPIPFSSPLVAARALAAQAGEANPPLDWSAVAVFDAIKKPGLSLVPSFTLMEAEGGGIQSEIVLLLSIETSVDSQAKTQKERLQPFTGRSARAANPLDTPFNLIVQAMLSWSIHALLGRITGNITAVDLDQLKADLKASDSGPSYQRIKEFMAKNFTFQISGIPQNLEDSVAVDSAIFPIIPELWYSLPDGTQVHFSSKNPVTQTYEEFVVQYYDQLLIDYDVDRATNPTGPRSAPVGRLSPIEDGEQSMATLIFKMYLLMVARAGVQAAVDVLKTYRYPLGQHDSLDSIAAQFPPVATTYVVQAGDDIDSVCDKFGMTVAQLQGLNGGNLTDPLLPGTILNVIVSVTPESIAVRNQTILLQSGAQLTLTDVPYQLSDADTLSSLTQRFAPATAAALFGDAANQANPFLLKTGGSILIAEPGGQNAYDSFQYVSVAGDGLDLLAAFLFVRTAALATLGDNLAWYRQTISDLNGSAVDFSASLAGGVTVKVPPALNDSEPAHDLTYISHAGDTLDWIAGYFLLLQNQPASIQPIVAALQSLNPGVDWNNLPVGTILHAPAQTRILQPADTLLSVAGLFYLDPVSFAGGPNATSTDLLAPLAVIKVPSLVVTVGSADTLLGLASRYNLSVSELANEVAGVDGLFAYPAAEPLTIPDVPQADIPTLVQQAVLQGGANLAAKMTSRFLAAGMRLPVPSDMSEFDGMYDLAGQQLATPASSNLPYAITFNVEQGATWIEFVSSRMSSEGLALADLAPSFPRIEALNPGIDWSRPLPRGAHLFTEQSADLVITITQALIDASAPSTTFDPIITQQPAPLPLFNLSDVRYTLHTVEHWQAAIPPAFSGGQMPPTGEPTIWTFTDVLMARVAELGSGVASFALNAEAGKDSTPVQLYDWATMASIDIRQVFPPDSQGVPIPNTYEFAGADEASRSLLLDLFTYLSTTTNDESGTRLYLLFTPNADTNNAQGYASDTVQPSAVSILQTNLSTLTTGGTALEQSVPAYYATMDQPQAFLRLLWEGSVTGTGGYAIRFANTAGDGLPNQVFASSSVGNLKLLVILGSQSSGQSENRKLYGFNNCVVVGDNIDPAGQSVYVQAADAQNVDQVKIASVPPGNAGFSMARQDPNAEDPANSATLTRLLFSLLAYQVDQGGGFSASNESVPLSPSSSPTSGLETLPLPSWYYRAVLPIAKFATSVLPDCPGLPPPATDPYAGISAGAGATVSLSFQDLYGNLIEGSAAPSVVLPIGYTDDLVGLSLWPGIATSYEIVKAGNDPAVKCEIAFQAANYAPAPGNSFSAALQAAGAHLQRYGRIYLQMWQPDVSLQLTTSLNQASGSQPHAYPLDKLPVANFVSGAYIFLSAAAQQKAAQATIGQNDTIQSLALAMSGASPDLLAANVAAFGEANALVPTANLFSSSVQLPSFHTAAYGDTLADIAALVSPNFPVTQLAQNNANVPLNAGVDIVAPARQSPPTVLGQSLGDVATQMHATAAGIAIANATRRDILKNGQTITVNGTSVNVGIVPEIGTTESFDDLVQTFKSAGLLTTVAQIGAASAGVPDLFNPGVTLQVADYVIEPGSTFESLAAKYSQFTVSALAGAAAGSPNVFLSGTPIFLQALAPAQPSSSDTLASLAQTQGLSLDQLTAFNQTTPLAVGKPLNLPERVQIAASAASPLAPYFVKTGDSLQGIAAAFAETDTLALATRNATLGYVFLPQQTIAVGTASTQTLFADSMNSVLARLQGQDSSVTFEQLIAQIGPSTTLLAPNALFATRLPSTGSLTSLNALRSTFNADPSAIAQANASLLGFLKAGAQVTVGGISLITLALETFTSLVQRFKIEQNVETSVAEIASQNAAVSLLGPSAAFLLPPNPVNQEIDLGPSPAFPGTIFPLRVDIAVARDQNFVNHDFLDRESVWSSVAALPPKADPSQSGPLSLRAFAKQAEAAFAYRVKIAASQEQEGAGRLFAVSFEPGAIQSVTIAGSSPSFFSIQPLSNKLRDQKGVPIRSFDPLTGNLIPAVDPPTLDYQAVDLEKWAAVALPAVDLMLSPAYAIPAYLQNPNAFNRLVAAKGTLAQAISLGVANVLGAQNSGAVVADAQERLRQELLISLTRGYGVDAIIQYPTTAVTSFTAEETAPRLSGQPQCSTYRTGQKDTIQTLSSAFAVSQVGIATLLGPIVRILNDQVSITFGGNTYPIPAGATIDSLIQTVGASGYQAFVDGLSAPNGFFAPQTILNVYGSSVVTGATTASSTGPTLETVTRYFDTGFDRLILQNQEKTGIFIEGATISVPGHSPVQVTGANNSLNLMAAAIGGFADTLQFSLAIQAVSGILSPTFTFSLASLVPAYNLSPAKTSLFNGSGTVNTLLSLKSESKPRKLVLDLNYPINELEYDIATVPDTGGYQSSSWLSFVIPLGEDPDEVQPVDLDPGAVEIPIPLRAYPYAPIMLGQQGNASHRHPADVPSALQWTYGFDYRHQDAPQDATFITCSFNVPGAAARRLLVAKDPFASLAQFTNVYADVQKMLVGLLQPRTDIDPVLAQTIDTFVTMVENIANNWGYPESPVTLAMGEQWTLSYRADFTTKSGGLLDTFSLSLLANAPQFPISPFPDISWRVPSGEWNLLEKVSETATECVYRYLQPVGIGIPMEQRLAFAGLNIVQVQNALGSTRLTRNQSLVVGNDTAEPFVYTTDWVAFPQTLQPFLVQEALIPFGVVGQTLESALADLFATILGSDATNYSVKVSAAFGYDLVDSDDSGVDPIVSLLPILFQPRAPFDTGLPGRLATALQTWQTGKPFSANEGLYVFDIAVYTSIDVQNFPPLVELKRLYFDRSNHTSPRVRRRL
ncbi:MAG TPA: LysM peptidoglycan-binding domain-containing protein [Fimbriimonadaceae bacterium]|nr:LysM peptidoglycan-binding domain-containing protein [Fimbriimonadaceae bacterium]